MRYVTFYSTCLGGVSNITVHKDKAAAIKFYRNEAPSYFNGLLRLPKTTKPPTSCGFPHRYFSVMSMRRFKKEYPEEAKAMEALSDTKEYCGRKTAMWENGTDYEYEFAYCSACGHMQFADWNTHCEAKEKIGHFHEKYHYCPECGAKMKGGTYIE